MKEIKLQKKRKLYAQKYDLYEMFLISHFPTCLASSSTMSDDRDDTLEVKEELNEITDDQKIIEKVKTYKQERRTFIFLTKHFI